MRKQSSLALLGWLYVVLIALWLGARALFFDQIWWLALVNTIAEYLFLPLPLLVIAALWRRRWRLLLGLCIPAGAFGLLFGALFLPNAADTTDAQRPAVVAMTFNVLWSNKDLPALTRAIRAGAPDIVGFQELTRTHKDRLAQSLAADYPYHTFTSLAEVEDVGLLSRYPIESVVPVALPPLNHALHATIRVDGRRLHVFVAHLTPNHAFEAGVAQLAVSARASYANRAAETAQLAAQISALHEPALLLCDCNLTDTSEAYATLNRLLTDSFSEAGWGFGHSLYFNGLPFPAQRDDYIWHTPGLTAITAAVGANGGSDHLPVVARLRFDT